MAWNCHICCFTVAKGWGRYGLGGGRVWLGGGGGWKGRGVGGGGGRGVGENGVCVSEEATGEYRSG